MRGRSVFGMDSTRRDKRKWRLTMPRMAGLVVLLIAVAIAPGAFAATRVDGLAGKIGKAKSDAAAISQELASKQAELGDAQAQADAAAAREASLSALLSSGEERSRQLGEQVRQSEDRFAVEKRRLARARHQLAERLIAIYMTGDPNPIDVALRSDGFDDLVTRTDYMQIIESSDAALAKRVEQVRNSVSAELASVKTSKEQADAHAARLASAQSAIAGVRLTAEQQAAALAGAASSKQDTLSTLRSDMSEWSDQLQKAQAAATPAEADIQVSEMLGGPYSIPTYIVMCESGGNYSAVNASSGAGGAYQIMPSTWESYGGTGAPQDGSKAEQDRIAAMIWTDSGGSAWVCAG